MKKTLHQVLIKTIVLFLFAQFYTLATAQSQTGKITGTVKSTTEALKVASLQLKNTSIGTFTDDNGKFSLDAPTGEHTLLISYTGFVTKEIPVSVKADQTLSLGDITLEASNEVLEEVTVSAMISKFSKKESEQVARMPLENLENPQVYTVVPKELFEEQVLVDFKSALMSSPGVANVTLGVGSGGTGLTMFLRGFSGANGAGAVRNGMATN